MFIAGCGGGSTRVVVRTQLACRWRLTLALESFAARGPSRTLVARRPARCTVMPDVPRPWPNYLSFPPYVWSRSHHSNHITAAAADASRPAPIRTPRHTWLLPYHRRWGHLVRTRIPTDPPVIHGGDDDDDDRTDAAVCLYYAGRVSDLTQCAGWVARARQHHLNAGWLGNVSADWFGTLFPAECQWLRQQPPSAATGDEEPQREHALFLWDVSAASGTDTDSASPSADATAPPVSLSGLLSQLWPSTPPPPQPCWLTPSASDADACRSLRWITFRSRPVRLPDLHASVLAQVRTLAEWHQRTRYCTQCGGRLREGNWTEDEQEHRSPSSSSPSSSVSIGASELLGRSKQCAACAHTVYPRIDPVVIVLVTAITDDPQQPRNDRTTRAAPVSPQQQQQQQLQQQQQQQQHWCLLGRKRVWPTGRYSCIAGFVEAGETLEEAVLREVEEESGVRLQPGSVRYAHSQTWPFPSQLMVAFYAQPVMVQEAGMRQLPRARNVDDELERVQWFRAEQVRAALPQSSPAFHLPGREAIAHRLIVDWLQAVEDGTLIGERAQCAGGDGQQHPITPLPSR